MRLLLTGNAVRQLPSPHDSCRHWRATPSAVKRCRLRFSRLCHRQSRPRALLRSSRLPDIAAPEHPTLALVLDGVADPGNAGTLLRSAEAAGADSVVFGPGAVDAYNDKVMRAGMGAHFRLPIRVLRDWPAVASALGDGVRTVRGRSRGRAGIRRRGLDRGGRPHRGQRSARPQFEPRAPWRGKYRSLCRGPWNRSTRPWPEPSSSLRRRASEKLCSDAALTPAKSPVYHRDERFLEAPS